MNVCKEVQRSRFRIVKLEERIAPSATILNAELGDDASAHLVVTPSGNVNGNVEVDAGLAEVESEFHLHPQQL